MENGKILLKRQIDLNLDWSCINIKLFLNDVEKLKSFDAGWLEVDCELDEYNNKEIKIKAYKESLETDEEYERRINTIKKVDDMNRERRYQEFLKLQKEFGN